MQRSESSQDLFKRPRSYLNQEFGRRKGRSVDKMRVINQATVFRDCKRERDREEQINESLRI